MPPRRRIVAAAAAAALTSAAAGCADPYEAPPPSSPPGQEVLPPRRVPHESSARPTGTPAAAARRAAALTGTWTPRSHAARQALFASEAVGPAQASGELAAARSATTRLAERSTTRVLAVTSLRRRPRSAQLVLLVRERRQDAGGRPSARWRVIEASATRQARGWAISRWAPQP